MLASVAAMSAMIRPRGPLPARTYWVRRMLIIGTALALVVGVGNLLTRGSDGAAGTDRAVQTAADASDPAGPSAAATPTSGGNKHRDKKPKKPPLATPVGTCEADDIDVQPIVKDAVAGDTVTLRLRLRTRVNPACYWHVSSHTVTLKITSGSDDIWNSRECPRAVPSRDVVLRQAKPAWVGVTWSTRRSDEGCTVNRLWALPGWYHLEVAALAGEPEDIQFELQAPEARVITESPDPQKRGKHQGQHGGKPGDGTSASPGKPSKSPSGAVEPD